MLVLKQLFAFFKVRCSIRVSCKSLARANTPAYMAGTIVINKNVFLTLKLVINDIKHSSSLLTLLANKLEFFSIGKPLQLGLMFVGKAGSLTEWRREGSWRCLQLLDMAEGVCIRQTL
jgi:hypothetical protein